MRTTLESIKTPEFMDLKRLENERKNNLLEFDKKAPSIEIYPLGALKRFVKEGLYRPIVSDVPVPREQRKAMIETMLM